MKKKGTALLIIMVIMLIVGGWYYITYRPFTAQPSQQEKTYVGVAIHPAGYQTDYSPNYWVNAINHISAKVPNSEPIAVWVIGVAESSGICHLLFPGPQGSYPSISFLSTDNNEEYLDAFDIAGIKVWLTVEPSDADVETLIGLVWVDTKTILLLLVLG